MSRNWWSRGQLEKVLIAQYGGDAKVDMQAAARGLKVSVSTIRRWLDVPTYRHRARIPERQRQRLLEAAAVPAWVIERDRRQAARARESLAKIRAGVRPSETWLAQGWLEPHLVQVVADGARRIRYVRFANLDQPWRYGHVLHETQVPSRFHAEILVEFILQQIAPWRVSLQGKALRDAGQHRAWSDAAPAVRLEELVRELPAPIAARKVAAARAASAEARAARRRVLQERDEKLAARR